MNNPNTGTNATRLLILVDWFAPGYKGGGPIRSTVNLALALKATATVSVLTSNRDFGEKEGYQHIAPNLWNHQFDPAVPVYYFSSEHLSYKNMLQVLREQQPGVIYLNSMFSLPFTIWPLVMKWRGQITAKVVLAPRGMLHQGALVFKKRKKQLFLTAMRCMGINRLVHFHATDQQEQADIARTFGSQARVTFIPNLPSQVQPPFNDIPKQPGELKLVFISRVHAKKNVHFLLQCLAGVQGNISLNIYGGIEDAHYLQQCNAIIETLPGNITVGWQGAVPHEAVPAILQQHHAFILPTLGENFGHAIFEAFLAGRPVIISNQTPWANLNTAGIGADLPLNNQVAWQNTLQVFADMNQDAFNGWCRRSWQFAARYIANPQHIAQYSTLFFEHN